MAGNRRVYEAASQLRKEVNALPMALFGAALAVAWNPIKFLAKGTAKVATTLAKMGKAIAWNPVTRYVGREIAAPWLMDAGKKTAQFGAGVITGMGRGTADFLAGGAYIGTQGAKLAGKAAFRNISGTAEAGLKNGQFINYKLRRGMGLTGSIGVIGVGTAIMTGGHEETRAQEVMENPSINRVGAPNAIDTMGASGNLVLAAHKLR